MIILLMTWMLHGMTADETVDDRHGVKRPHSVTKAVFEQKNRAIQDEKMIHDEQMIHKYNPLIDTQYEDKHVVNSENVEHTENIHKKENIHENTEKGIEKRITNLINSQLSSLDLLVNPHPYYDSAHTDGLHYIEPLARNDCMQSQKIEQHNPEITHCREDDTTDSKRHKLNSTWDEMDSPISANNISEEPVRENTIDAVINHNNDNKQLDAPLLHTIIIERMEHSDTSNAAQHRQKTRHVLQQIENERKSLPRAQHSLFNPSIKREKYLMNLMNRPSQYIMDAVHALSDEQTDTRAKRPRMNSAVSKYDDTYFYTSQGLSDALPIYDYSDHNSSVNDTLPIYDYFDINNNYGNSVKNNYSNTVNNNQSNTVNNNQSNTVNNNHSNSDINNNYSNTVNNNHSNSDINNYSNSVRHVSTNTLQNSNTKNDNTLRNDYDIPYFDGVLQIITDGTTVINQLNNSYIQTVTESIRNIIYNDESVKKMIETTIEESNRQFYNIIGPLFTDTAQTLVNIMNDVNNREYTSISNNITTLKKHLNNAIIYLLSELGYIIGNINTLQYITPVVREENEKVMEQIRDILTNGGTHGYMDKSYNSYNEMDEQYEKLNAYNEMDERLNHNKSYNELNTSNALKNYVDMITFPDPVVVGQKIGAAIKQGYLSDYNDALLDKLGSITQKIQEITDLELAHAQGTIDSENVFFLRRIEDTLNVLMNEWQYQIRYKSANEIRRIRAFVTQHNEQMKKEILDILYELPQKYRRMIEDVTDQQITDMGPEILGYNWQVAEAVIKDEIQRKIEQKIREKIKEILR